MMEKEKDTTREVKHEAKVITLRADPPKVLKGAVLRPATADLANK
jgi:hypothetical protein